MSVDTVIRVHQLLGVMKCNQRWACSETACYQSVNEILVIARWTVWL